MNVDILENNPDWRWFILVVGASLALSFLGWLAAKYTQVCVVFDLMDMDTESNSSRHESNSMLASQLSG